MVTPGLNTPVRQHSGHPLSLLAGGAVYNAAVLRVVLQQLQQRLALGLLEAMESRGLLGDAQSIDVSTASTVTMEYAGRLTVKMKMSADFDYDMRVLATVMEEYVESKWSAEDTGTLDMTLDDGLPHLIKNAAEN